MKNTELELSESISKELLEAKDALSEAHRLLKELNLPPEEEEITKVREEVNDLYNKLVWTSHDFDRIAGI